MSDISDNGNSPTGDFGRTFYCQFDTAYATKDYLRYGRCVRLLGIEPLEFNAAALDDGVTTFIIDIDYWAYCQHEFDLSSWRQVTKMQSAALDEMEEQPSPSENWIRVDLVPSADPTKGKVYAYRTFSEEPPVFYDLASMRQEAGPVLRASAASPVSHVNHSVIDFNSASRRDFVFDAFHVGQGMCSLVHDDVTGVLLDAGAGKPINRADYLAGRLTNQLSQRVASLQRLGLVISHLDSDHWRLLSWDANIRKQLNWIVVPAGTAGLPLRDKAIQGKIISVNDSTILLGPRACLSLYRSRPNRSDRNGECLVSVFNKGSRRVLAPGDYVYSRFATDGNPAISDLTKYRYVGVQVPHHGDAASAQNVLHAATHGRAFFSAGTHQGYRHPTDVSLRAHRTNSYRNLSNPKLKSILPRRLS